MDANISTILVALVVSVVSPLISNWSRRREKVLDWQRQDEVAARLVENDASKFAKLDKLQATADGTKVIVNNQRTALLLLNADLRERIARDNPNDHEAQRAARAARLEADLSAAANSMPH